MSAGKTLVEIHRPLCGIDGLGNFNLNTVGKLNEQVQAGNIPIFGGKGIPTNVTITNAQGATSNICNVTFQVTDTSGNAVAGFFSLDVWLSDAATGGGLTATTASGGIAAAASGGAVFGVETTSKAVFVQTNSSGAFVLAITDTAKTGFYPVACINVVPTVGAQLTSASYK